MTTTTTPTPLKVMIEIYDWEGGYRFTAIPDDDTHSRIGKVAGDIEVHDDYYRVTAAYQRIDGHWTDEKTPVNRAWLRHAICGSLPYTWTKHYMILSVEDKTEAKIYAGQDID